MKRNLIERGVERVRKARIRQLQMFLTIKKCEILPQSSATWVDYLRVNKRCSIGITPRGHFLYEGQVYTAFHKLVKALAFIA